MVRHEQFVRARLRAASSRSWLPGIGTASLNGGIEVGASSARLQSITRREKPLSSSGASKRAASSRATAAAPMS